MRQLIIIHGWWPLLLSFSGIWSLLYIDVFQAAVLLIFAVISGFVLLDLSRSKRWAWWASGIPMTIFLALSVPMVVYNCYLFITNDDLYLDSPATIFVVAIYTILFVIPALASVISLILARKCFFSSKYS